MTTMYPSKLSKGSSTIKNTDFVLLTTISDSVDFTVPDEGWYYLTAVASSSGTQTYMKPSFTISINNVRQYSLTSYDNTVTRNNRYEFHVSQVYFLKCINGDVINVAKSRGTIRFNIYKYSP